MSQKSLVSRFGRMRFLVSVLVIVLVIAEAFAGWGRHKLGYQLAVAGYPTAARLTYATLASDRDSLALNNYAALLDMSMTNIPSRVERRRVFLQVRDMYNRAAANGLLAAQFNAGLQTYRATPPKSPDFPAAKEWLRQAADGGDSLAALAYARDLSFLRNSPEYPERMRRLRMLADAGSAEAQGLYGRALRGEDEERAIPYLRAAAQQGHFVATEELGFVLLRTAPDEALIWLRNAAEGGSIPAQGALGEIYKEGELVPVDDVQAVHWLGMAADQTNVRRRVPEVLYFLDRSGFRCCLTTGGWMDNINNDVDAAYELAELYAEGRGVERDLERARNLYAKAAKINWKDSQERLQQIEGELAR
jgi:TPR repeat protein